MTIGWMASPAARRGGAQAARSRDWTVGAVLVALLVLLAAGALISPPPAGTSDDAAAVGRAASQD